MKVLPLYFLISFFSAPHASAQFDPPNEKVEERMHKVFEKYNSAPVEDSKWQSMLGQRRSEVYQIQTGDSLWDISETFFGDGKYWPKLWSENGTIENPHQILPRRKVGFLSGTESDAPAFTLLAEHQEVATPNAPIYVATDEVDDGQIDSDEPRVVGGAPVIPKPMKPATQVLKNLPPSFVSATVPKPGEFDASGLDARANAKRSASTELTIPFYVSNHVPDGVGSVDEIEIADDTAGSLQAIYVKLAKGASVGDKFSVYGARAKVEGDYATGGPIIEVEGRIEVVEVLNEADHIYRCLVLESLNPVRKGSIVSEQPLTQVNFDFNGPHGDVEATVMGGEFDKVRKILGFGGIVYLNKGSDSGLREGDLLAIQAVRSSRKEDSPFPDTRRPIGVVKIAKVESDVATAIVLQSNDDIHPGDLTGGRFPAAEKSDVVTVSPVLDVDEKGIRPR